MAQVIAILDRAVRAAGVPIDGVSIGDPANRATWTVQFRPSATAAKGNSLAVWICNPSSCGYGKMLRRGPIPKCVDRDRGPSGALARSPEFARR